jgi:hypothetical protein
LETFTLVVVGGGWGFGGVGEEALASIGVGRGMGRAGEAEQEAVASDELGRQSGICDVVDAGRARGIDIGSLLSSALERGTVVASMSSSSLGC